MSNDTHSGPTVRYGSPVHGNVTDNPKTKKPPLEDVGHKQSGPAGKTRGQPAGRDIADNPYWKSNQRGHSQR